MVVSGLRVVSAGISLVASLEPLNDGRSVIKLV